jgi:oxaloacetate decarboxylase alpha subunit
MHDMDAARATARRLKRAGVAEVVGALTFTISTVHDDPFYADLAGQMRECPDIDRVYVKDPAGILTAERARTLLPAIKAELGPTPLELHSHATIGLSPLTYSIAPDLGVEVVQTGCGVLGNGSSLPEVRRTVANLREMGHRVEIDDRTLGLACDFFERLAAADELPVGRPQDFDAAFLHHQIAGGVMTTTRRQLREIGMEDRFDSLIEEVARVRAELGYPIMVTPFPQMVVSLALFNVMGERYANVPDQVIRYVLGSFGRPTAPIDPQVQDRILDRPRARELAAEPDPPTPGELRRQFGHTISDEELLLRAHMPAEQVDAMLAAGPAPGHYNPRLAPVLSLLGELRDRRSVHDLAVAKPNLRLFVHRRRKGAVRA